MAEKILLEYEIELEKLRTQFNEIVKESAKTQSVVEANAPKYEIKGLDALKKSLIDIAKASDDVDISSITTEVNKLVNDSKKLEQTKSLFEKIQSQTQANTHEFKQYGAVIRAIEAQMKSLEATATKATSGTIGAAEKLNAAWKGVLGSIDSIKGGDLSGGLKSLTAEMGNLTKSALAFVATPIGAAIAALSGVALIGREIFNFNLEIAALDKQLKAFGIPKEQLSETRSEIKATADAFGFEFKEIAERANTLAKAFGLSVSEANRIISEGLANGGASNTEFLDSIAEFPKQFKNAGYSAQEFINILNKGFELGVYKDKLPDAIKEATLSLSEQSQATRDALTNAFGASFSESVLERIKTGEISVKQALEEIASKAKETSLNQQQVAQLTADIFRGAGEDAGGALVILEAVSNASKTALNESAKAQLELVEANERLNKAQSQLFEISGFGTIWAKIKTEVLNALSSTIEWLAETRDAIQPLISIVGGTFVAAWELLKSTVSIFFNTAKGALESFSLSISTVFNFFKKIISGDIRGALDVFGSYFVNLGNIVGRVFTNIYNTVLNTVQGLVGVVRPLLQSIGVDTDKLINKIEGAKRATPQTAKQPAQSDKQQPQAGAVSVTDKKKPTTSSSATVSGDKSKSKTQKTSAAEKTTKDPYADAIAKEKAYNETIIKLRDNAIKQISKSEIEQQKSTIEKLTAQRADPQLIQAEKIKLLEAEKAYQEQVLKVRKEYEAKLLANAKTKDGQFGNAEAVQAQIEASEKVSEQIKDINERISNENTRLQIDNILKTESEQIASLERQKKAIEGLSTKTKEEENKKRLEILAIDTEIQQAKINNAIKTREELAKIVDPSSELLKKQVEIEQQATDKLVEIARQRSELLKEIDRQRIEESLKNTENIINSLVDGYGGLISLGIGIDEGSLNELKNSISEIRKTLSDPNLNGAEKFKASFATAFSSLSNLAKSALDGVLEAEKQASQQRIEQLNAQQEEELALAGENEEKKELIKQKFDLKLKEEKRKAFEAEKRASVLRAIISTAEAVVKTLASVPFPFNLIAAAGVGALGAAQIALINSQPVPKFEKGGLVGGSIAPDGSITGRPHAAGGVLIEAEGGEFITRKKQVPKHLELLRSINDDKALEYINSQYVLPAVKQAEAQANEDARTNALAYENNIISRAIVGALDAIKKENRKNTENIVDAVKKKNFTL